ncbi:MAG TPA: DsbA family protein [Longimicrobiales bacterium]|nr:DsbA family protein [Longimicrobiales bacterium]
MSAGGNAPPLILWSDFICPFSRLAEAQVVRLAREYGTAVEHRPYELAPPGTPPLPPEDARFWDEVVAPAARELGVPMRRPPLRPRTRKAHELAALAREASREAAIRAALFAAVFEEGEDIGRVDVLVAIAAGAGMDPSQVKVTLDLDTYADAVAAAERHALEMGVTGTPAARVGETMLTGLHSYGALLDLLRSES